MDVLAKERMSDGVLVEAMFKTNLSNSPERGLAYPRKQMTKKSLMTKALGMTAPLFFFGGCEQADDKTAASGQEPETNNEARSTNLGNPTEVAKAFINSIVAKDFKKAVEYVAPDQRDEFEKALGEEMPPIPTNPDIQVRVKENGVQADVAVLNAEEPQSGAPFGLDMSLINGKWWIVK